MNDEFSFISKETFDRIVCEYLEIKSKGKDKSLIDMNTYNDIKFVLLDGKSTIRDSQFRNWCRSGFTLLPVGEDFVVCKKLNEKAKKALVKEGKTAEELPVLILEKMYEVIGQEHVENVHCGQKALFNKLKSKWSGVKKKLIEEFVNNCEVCVPRRSSSKSTLAAKPIVAGRFLSRIQVINFNY
jgi:hypothetical protein